MKKIVLFCALFLSAASLQAQSVSDAQVVEMAQQELKNGASEQQVAAKLLQAGATKEQLQRLRSQYGNQKTGSSSSSRMTDGFSRMRQNNDGTRTDAKGQTGSRRQSAQKGQAGQYGEDNYGLPEGAAMNMDNPDMMSSDDNMYDINGKRKIFGHDIFNRGALTFEPQMNIATPHNYVLGPGDQVVVDIYGASQESYSLTVSPDGDVVVPEYGPISISGLTVTAAQSRIRSKLGGYFSSSEIKVTVGQTRSITVNVMGEVKTPGTYTLSAFSTVFHALYMAGGIGDLGTLRNVKVYRGGRLISVVDIYEFILNGRLAGNVRLQDNDVVQVGPYDCIVDITGKVKRPMLYEMRKGESLFSLLKYSGGFTGDAYKKQVRVLRKSQRLKNVYNVDEFDFSTFKLDDGDEVSVDSLFDRFENMVEVQGAVYRPGMYRLGGKISTVRGLVEAADGLMAEAMTSRAVLRRMKANRTQEVLTIDMEGIMNGTTADVPLKNEDKLFIPTLSDHQNLRTLTIGGEVIFPGVYEYADGMSVEDLIVQAGGLTDYASMNKVDVSRRMLDPNATTAGMYISQTYSFPLTDSLKADGASGKFVLKPYDIVQVRRTPAYQDPINVRVDGEISYQGTYTMERKNQRLSDLVSMAGGTVTGAYVRGARLMRKMTDDEKAKMQRILELAKQNQDSKDSVAISKLQLATTYSVGIHLDEALKNPGGPQDIELVDGDCLVIPRFNHTVRIEGEVFAPNTVAFESGKNYKYYIDQAGGFSNNAKKRKAYIVYQNGTMARATKGEIEPGCAIIVPSRAKRSWSDIAPLISLGTSAASMATSLTSLIYLITK